MFISTAHAAGSDTLPLPDNVDPAIFKYAVWGVGAIIALAVIVMVARRLTRK